MYQVGPITIVKNSRREVEEDDWGSVVSEIELLPPLDQEALLGLETFSHAEVVFLFDRCPNFMPQRRSHKRLGLRPPAFASGRGR